MLVLLKLDKIKARKHGPHDRRFKMVCVGGDTQDRV